MTTSSSSRAILNKKLSDLLGFEDGASDVLDHLLTIESSEDLLDYLSQLLGTENEWVQSFVNDIGRFQRGEGIVAMDDAEDNHTITCKQQAAVSTESKTAAATPNASSSSSATTKKAASTVATKTSKPAPPSIASKQAPPAAAFSNRTTKQTQTKANPSSNNNDKKSNLVPLQKKAAKSSANDEKAMSNPPPPPATKKAPPPAPKPAARPPPPKGKRKGPECGCFGYYHKPLTNCLICGRVSCEREGYDYCPFCEHLVQPPPAEGTGLVHDAAWMHKERLLQYDRESAQRTVVLDDQSDYFSMADERFMTEQERQEAHRKEEERSRKANERQKMTLNLAL